MSDSNNLFNDFKPSSYEEWKKQAQKELKDKSFNDVLTWKPFENTVLESYYSSDHFTSLNNVPGAAKGDWNIRQDIKVSDAKAANKKALDILMRGVTSVGFDIRGKENDSAIKELLKGILPEYVSINFLAGKRSPEIFRAFVKEVNERNINNSEVTGSIDYDAIGDALIYENALDKNVINEAIELISLAKKELPNFKIINVNGLHYNYHGDIVQELAYSLAHGNEYLSYFSKSLSVDDIASHMQFTFGVGTSYLLEIAKLRAFRSLWATIINQYKPARASASKVFIHCETSLFNLTESDPHSNILRATTEAMSAVIGGANSLTVIPFDSASKDSNNFSERISRNTQIILKEESYLDKVADPAKGSYYIETLTDKLASATWAEFQKIESMGGFLAAIKSGYISQELGTSFTKKKEAVESGKTVLVGTNKYREKMTV